MVTLDYSRCRVLLFRGRGLVSALIRWQTRSEFSHAALLLPDGEIIESWPGAGVRRKRLDDWKGVTAFTVLGMGAAKWEVAIDCAKSCIGQRYDWWNVIRFVSRRRLPFRHGVSKFCSELVFWAIRMPCLPLLLRVNANEVSPGMLALSPLLLVNSVDRPPDYP